MEANMSKSASIFGQGGSFAPGAAGRGARSHAHFDAEGPLAHPLVRRCSNSTARAISFGPFRLLPGQRLLLQAGAAVPLGSRALDMLIALVERPGELFSRDELMARVWPNLFVDPANLTVQIAALRRALGDGRDGNRFIVNVPGRGYQFVASVGPGEDGPARVAA
jgi:DNA-binding winged helix-turn-helix (wHTH) protein